MSDEAPRRLTPSEIDDELRQLDGWTVDGYQIVKTYKVADFAAAVDFVNRLAPVAEEQGHHPDLLIGWGRVEVHLSTHSAGGVSDADVELAKGIDRVAGA